MAVEAMHGANILHRDLKPANVFLKPETDPDGAPVLDVKLGDFGLSRSGRPQLSQPQESNKTRPL